MEGRWTIRVVDGDVTDPDDDWNEGVASVPVVPCDDAAIQRAAEGSWPIQRLADEDAWGHRLRVAREVLRAAGETP